MDYDTRAGSPKATHVPDTGRWIASCASAETSRALQRHLEAPCISSARSVAPRGCQHCPLRTECRLHGRHLLPLYHHRKKVTPRDSSRMFCARRPTAPHAEDELSHSHSTNSAVCAPPGVSNGCVTRLQTGSRDIFSPLVAFAPQLISLERNRWDHRCIE